MNVRLQITGPLGGVFPGFTAMTPLPDRLKMSIPGESTPALLTDVFAATPSITALR